MARLARWRHLIVVAAGYLVSLTTFSRLPGFEPDGGPLSARLLIALLLPTAAGLMYGLVCRVWARDPIRDADGAFEPTYSAIVFALVLYVVVIHAMVVTTLAGVITERGWQARATVVLFGLLMVRIGNLLPRTRPNLALGIRTPRTLRNRCLWMQTHRMAGYVTVGLGLVFALSGAFLSDPIFEPVMGSAMFGAAALFVVSYCLYLLRLRNLGAG